MKKTTLLIFGLLLIGQFQINAAHIVGGEMYYTCEGVGTYTLTIKMYRDCNGSGAQFDSTTGFNSTIGRLTVYQGDIEFDSYVMPAPIVSEIDVTTGNPCLAAPPNLCVEQGVYTMNLNLPVNAESYYIVYQRCCRNPTINNLVDPGDAGATYSVEITPQGQSTCNSSPRFVGLPPSVVCLDELLDYDYSAFDPDGDFIRYSFCEPINGGTNVDVAPTPDQPPAEWSPLTFNPPFSFANPMDGDPRITIGNTNGIISGIPEIEGQFVVVVCAEEYRGGELLSIIKREYQFNVTNCVPVIEAQIQSTEIVEDVFIIKECGTLDVQFNDTSFPSDNVDSYYWEIPFGLTDTMRWDSPNSIITFPDAGHYDGYLVVNPFTQCSDTAEFQVIITPIMNPSFDTDFDRCKLGSIEFDNTIVLPSVDEIEWAFDDGNFSNEEDPFYTYSLPGKYNVNLSYTDSLGCTEVYVDTVRYYPIPEDWEIQLDSMTDTSCPPVDLFFSVKSDFLTDEYGVTWSTGDGGTGFGYSYQHTYEVAGIYDVSVDIESPTGCTDSKSYPAFIDLPFGFYIPNIFSPAAFDPVNQQFCIDILCDLREYQLRIYDVRGTLIFQSLDFNHCWDGYFDGVKAETGVYVYRMDFLDKYGVERQAYGDVTLIR